MITPFRLSDCVRSLYMFNGDRFGQIATRQRRVVIGVESTIGRFNPAISFGNRWQLERLGHTRSHPEHGR